MTNHAESSMISATTLAVGGMTCAGCARTIERVLSRVPGVQSAAVDFDLGIAIVNGSATPLELSAAIEKAGYSASLTDAAAARGK